MHLSKRGLRILGIAESYSSRERSILAGVVMRRDLRIDGVTCGWTTVGGTDATDAVTGIVTGLSRNDIHVVMLSGCVIAWYNVMDGAEVSHRTGLPVVCVTYEESGGLRQNIEREFPGDSDRIAAYERLGARIPVILDNGFTQFIRCWGIAEDSAARLSRELTLDGKIPEPLRVARLCARAFRTIGCSVLPDRELR